MSLQQQRLMPLLLLLLPQVESHMECKTKRIINKDVCEELKQKDYDGGVQLDLD
jgi:hypothetical protein